MLKIVANVWTVYFCKVSSIKGKIDQIFKYGTYFNESIFSNAICRG